MTISINISGTWRTVSQPYIRTGDAWKTGKAMYTKVNNVWKQVWPADTGTPQIVGVRHGGTVGSNTFDWTSTLPQGAYGSTYFPAPKSPYYRVIGDKTQIASAVVNFTWDTSTPKSATHVVTSWTCPDGWGIYLVVLPVENPNYPNYWNYEYYYAGMTTAEAAAIASPKLVYEIWTPRNGGYFAPMPVCWELSGKYTYPVRTTTNLTDTHTLAGSNPTGVSAVTTLVSDGTAADYTVAEGYADMDSVNTSKTNMTFSVQLKNSGGTVLSSWSGSLDPNFADTPGILYTASRTAKEQPKEYYWPTEWRGIFDNFPTPDPKIEWYGESHKGEGIWNVYLYEELVGDFRLGLIPGITDSIQICGVNIRQDLIGLGVMKDVVRHGTRWSPMRFVFVEPPDEITYAVMQSWGWTPLEDASKKSKSYEFYRKTMNRESGKFLIYDTHVPMYNRFSELGLPEFEEVAQW